VLVNDYDMHVWSVLSLSLCSVCNGIGEDGGEEEEEEDTRMSTCFFYFGG